jgi:hypothetical protein
MPLTRPRDILEGDMRTPPIRGQGGKERSISVGSYSAASGLRLEWSTGFRIEVGLHSGEVLINANKAGLTSLQKLNG